LYQRYLALRDPETPTAAAHIRTSEPKTLTLQVPEGLTAGTYRIEVRNTRYDTEKLRTGLYPPPLN
jgi:hypothetical protein